MVLSEDFNIIDLAGLPLYYFYSLEMCMTLEIDGIRRILDTLVWLLIWENRAPFSIAYSSQ